MNPFNILFGHRLGLITGRKFAYALSLMFSTHRLVDYVSFIILICAVESIVVNSQITVTFYGAPLKVGLFFFFVSFSFLF